jgi:hypothetical protein
VTRKEEKMRLVHAAALTVAALLLASAASAQGLGDAAAREKEKRKATSAKPAKVYTEGDIGSGMAPVSATPDLPATAEGAAGKPAGEGGAKAEGAAKDPEKAAEEARAKAEADWRKRLDQARKEEGVYKDVIAKLQLELNDTSGGFYNPGRASRIAFQDENKQKLAEVQGRITALEEEGRRNGYR